MRPIVILAAVALAGDWVSTPDGQRVCQLTSTPAMHSIIGSGFCENWQLPYRQVQHGEQIPFSQGWIRRVKPMAFWETRWGTMQVHIEGKGWLP